MALKVKVGLFPTFDMLKFKNMGANREKVIEKAQPASGDIGSYHVNDLADALHPNFQDMVITGIENYEEAGTRTYTLTTSSGKPAAYFSAGQYVSVTFRIDGEQVYRPYFICSSPKLSIRGSIKISIRARENGFVSKWANDNLKLGDRLRVSGPEGHLNHNPVRDHRHVIALGFDNSVTPFLSMAAAVADGTEDYDLTIITEADSEKEFFFAEELAKYPDNGHLKVVYCLKGDTKPGYVSGEITPELIKQYAGDEPYSLIVSGTPRVLKRAEKVVAELNKPKREVRYTTRPVPADIYSYPGFPEHAKNVSYRVTVWQGFRSYSIVASSAEPLMVSLERARIKAPGKCRSGECSWCRSKLLSGDVFVPGINDHRRKADRDNGHIHPCCSFPVSDLEIEIPGTF